MNILLMEVKYLIPVGIVAAFLIHFIILKLTGTSKKLDKCERDEVCYEEADSTIGHRFEMAVKQVNNAENTNLSDDQRLKLYAYFKQAKYGKCRTPQPSMIDFVAKAKWDSWMKLGDLEPSEAKKNYINLVHELLSHNSGKSAEVFDDVASVTSDVSSSTEREQGVSMTGLGVTVSTMSMEDSDPKDWEIIENIFHYASTGANDQVLALIASGTDKNSQDEEGRGILHWAVDRDHLDTVEKLLEIGVDVDIKDNDGMTPLAYAVNCEYVAIAEALVNAGADVNSVDNDGDSPLSIAPPEIKPILLRSIPNN